MYKTTSNVSKSVLARIGVLAVGVLFSVQSYGHYVYWVKTFPDDKTLVKISNELPNDLDAEYLYLRLTDPALRSVDRMSLFAELCRRNTAVEREALLRLKEEFQGNSTDLNWGDVEIFYPMTLLYLSKMEFEEDLTAYTEALESLLLELPDLEHHLLQFHAAKELGRIGTRKARDILAAHLDHSHVASEACSAALADLEIGELTDREFFGLLSGRVQDRIRSGESNYGESNLSRHRIKENIGNLRFIGDALDRADAEPMSTKALQAEYILFLQRQMAIVRSMEQQDSAVKRLPQLLVSGERTELFNIACDATRRPYSRKNAYRILLELEMREKGIEGQHEVGYLLGKLEGKPIYPEDPGEAAAMPNDEVSRATRVTRLLLNMTIMRMIWNQGEIALPGVEEELKRARLNQEETPERLASLEELRDSLRRQGESRKRLAAWQELDEEKDE